MAEPTDAPPTNQKQETKPVKLKVVPPRYQEQKKPFGQQLRAEMTDAEKQQDRERRQNTSLRLLTAMQAKMKDDQKYKAMQEVERTFIVGERIYILKNKRKCRYERDFRRIR